MDTGKQIGVGLPPFDKSSKNDVERKPHIMATPSDIDNVYFVRRKRNDRRAADVLTHNVHIPRSSAKWNDTALMALNGRVSLHEGIAVTLGN